MLTAIGIKHGRQPWEIKTMNTNPKFYCHTESGRVYCSAARCKGFYELENAREVIAANRTIAEAIFKTDLQIQDWRKKRDGNGI